MGERQSQYGAINVWNLSIECIYQGNHSSSPRPDIIDIESFKYCCISIESKISKNNTVILFYIERTLKIHTIRIIFIVL